jgi:hypothetical protein
MIDLEQKLEINISSKKDGSKLKTRRKEATTLRGRPPG